MQKSDIIDGIGEFVVQRYGKEWKHDVGVYGGSSKHLNFVIDGKEYVLVLHEVTDGHCWNEYVMEGNNGEEH